MFVAQKVQLTYNNLCDNIKNVFKYFKLIKNIMKKGIAAIGKYKFNKGVKKVWKPLNKSYLLKLFYFYA